MKELTKDNVESNTGYKSNAAVTGDCSNAAVTGDCSNAAANGKDSIAVAWGIESKAKAAKGSYIVLSEWDFDEDNNRVLKCAKMAQVDGEKIKADTFYQLKDGEFVEVEQ